MYYTPSITLSYTLFWEGFMVICPGQWGLGGKM